MEWSWNWRERWRGERELPVEEEHQCVEDIGKEWKKWENAKQQEDGGEGVLFHFLSQCNFEHFPQESI